MKLLFVHQNLPGQFVHLLARFGGQPDHEVVGIGVADTLRDQAPRLAPGVRYLGYRMRPPRDVAAVHPFLRSTDAAVRRGQAAAAAMAEVRRTGFVPDLVIAHPAWGEALYAKDVFPDSRLLCYGEFYYAPIGLDCDFDPEFPPEPDVAPRGRTRNLAQLASFEAADAILSPTRWQAGTLPASQRGKVTVIHDGIDTDVVRPLPSARFTRPDLGLDLTRDDEVVTYVSRNLEPYRGFHVFLRSLPRVLAARPRARVVVVGGDDVSYGRPPPSGTWREAMLRELDGRLDLSRVHFTGRLPYGAYLSLLQVSTVHVYLTYPFVLSWSLMEAMACGCTIVASDTPPVREVIAHGRHGHLVDFFDADGLADAVVRACADRAATAGLGEAARRAIVEGYDLRRVCLPRQVDFLTRLVAA